MPKFCIVIPTFNGAATLGEAVQSALAQEHDDYEVVVSDNASSDATAEVMARFASSRLRFRPHTACVGKTENWNRAFSSAGDCEYLVNLHSDDRLRAGCLRALERWTSYRPVVIHGGSQALFHRGARKSRTLGFPLPHRSQGVVAQELFLLKNIVSIVGAAMRRDAFESLGGWPPRYTFFQDVELWYLMAELGDVIYTPSVLGEYRDAPLGKNALGGNILEALQWFDERSRIEKEPQLREASLRHLADYADIAEQSFAEILPMERAAVRIGVETARATLRELGTPSFDRIARLRWRRLQLALQFAFSRK